MSDIHAILYKVALTRSGGIRCTYFSCLEDVQADANIMWFVDAVDASGEFGPFKLKDNMAAFQRFVQIFGSPPKAMCLFQLTHWEFVPHGPRAAHCLRASMRILDNPTSPECRQQFNGLVSLHTVDKVIERAISRAVDEDTLAHILTDDQCNTLRVLVNAE